MEDPVQTVNNVILDDKTPTTYYEQHKDAIKERYLNNTEALKAYQRDYNLLNSEKYTEYQKQYYERKRDELLRIKKEKITCECGKVVSTGHMTCHKKTNIHLKRMKKLEATTSS
jgi:hypothetical protein